VVEGAAARVSPVRTPDRLPREIWVLATAAFVIAIGYGLVAPAIPAFARSFDVGITAATFVISAFAVFRLAFAPVSGRLVGRFGELPTYLVGLGIVAVSTGACAFAAAYWQLLVFRALGGIGSTMFTVSSISLLVRLAPESMRGRASGLWATGFLMGNITGPLVGGGLVAISLRAPFIVYAGMLLVALVLTGVLLCGRTRGVTSEGGPVAAVTFRAALDHRAYRAALVANFAHGWAVFGVRVALVPLFVVEVLRQEEAWGGFALAVFAAGNAITLVGAGRLADRIGRRRPILVGLAVSAACTGVIGLVDDLALFLAVSLVAGLGGGLIIPPVNAAVADVIGSRARGGTVLAGFQMSADIGAIIGPVVAGLLAELVGYGAAFGLTGMVVAVGLLFWLRAPETLPGRAPAGPEPPSSAGEDRVADCASCDGPTPPRPR
jgi:DHA1 family tetracycline resistance protein-like MFS transporter